MTLLPPATDLAAHYRRRLMLGLAAAMVLRLVLLIVPVAFWIDMDSFLAWARHGAEVGLGHFYSPGYFCDYPPGYMAVLSLIGAFHHLYDPQWQHAGHGLGLMTWLKLPPLAADMASSYLIFLLLKGRVTIRSAYHGALVYAFNPLVIFVSGIWGQIDSVITLAMLGMTYLLLTQRAFAAAALGALSVMIKPQGVFFAPFFFLSQWFRRPWWFWPAGLALAAALIWGVTAPFSGFSLTGPFAFLAEKLTATANGYPYSSINAFNLWAPTCLRNGTLMWGEGYSDARTLLGIPHHLLGLGFMVLLSAWVGVFLYRKRHAGVAPLFLAAALLLLGFFLFTTRMHERYVFPAIAFLTLAASANRYLAPNLWGFTVTATLNALYVYLRYNAPAVFDAIPTPLWTAVIVGSVLANMWFFGDLVGYTLQGHGATPRKQAIGLRHALLDVAEAPPRVDPWARLDWLIMGGLAAVFFLVGLYHLGLPNEQIFDEVYHARTAQEYLKGISPYEWTHPPLAKLLIAVGIVVFGMNGFGWRIVSLVFGAIALAALYVLARRMFATRRPALIAAGLLALDGVFFVQSRVAMTNIYVACFLILAALATWEFMRTRRELMLPLAALALGGALSTRWTSLYAWGLLGLLIGAFVLRWEQPRRAPRQIAWLALRCLAYFTVIPGAVYLLSYVPYMLQGHGVGEVIAMQHNMWSYHAGLHATHSYSSPWWQWPFMVRPTWYYYHDWKNGTISGILAIGNPAIWWLSIPALLGMLYVGWRRKLWVGWFVATLGLGMYLMWGIEPRQLTFMHYMFESIPFATLAIAYFVDRLWCHEDWEPIATSYLVAVVGLFVFFYPLLAGIPIPEAFYRMHIWFGTWV